MKFPDDIDKLPDDWGLVAIGRNKAPYMGGWQHNPLTKADIWREYQAGRCHAVGLLLGPMSSGMMVIDVDGKSAEEVVERLSGSKELPPTAGITSGLEGHYAMLYKVPVDYWDFIETRKLKSDHISAEGKAELLEFRWTGCQQVLMGVHPKTGAYRDLEGAAIGEVEIADPPLWALETMLKASAFPQPIEQPIIETHGPIPLERCITKQHRSFIQSGCGAGERNDSGAALARDLIGTAAYLDVTGDQYVGDPRDLFNQFCSRCSPPIDEKEANQIWKSAEKSRPDPSLPPNYIQTCLDAWKKKWKSAATAGQGFGKDQASSADDEEDLTASAEKLCAEVQRIVDQFSFGSSNYLLRLHKLAQKVGINPVKVEQIYFTFKNEGFQTRIRTAKEIVEEQGKPTTFILGGLLPRGSTILFYADGGTGKSLLIYEILNSVCQGVDFLTFPFVQPDDDFRALLIQTDESENDLRMRLSDKEMRFSNLDIVTVWDFSKLNWLREMASSYDLIVVDSFSSNQRTAATEEKDAMHAAVLYELRDIAVNCDCTFLVLHHTNKRGQSRGSTAMRNNVSECWSMRKGDREHDIIQIKPRERIFEVEKSRSGVMNKLLLALNEDLSWSYVGDYGKAESGGDKEPATWGEKIYAWFAANQQTEVSINDLMSVTVLAGLKQETAKKTLKRLVSKGLIKITQTISNPSGGIPTNLYAHVRMRVPLSPCTTQTHTQSDFSKGTTQGDNKGTNANLSPCTHTPRGQGDNQGDNKNKVVPLVEGSPSNDYTSQGDKGTTFLSSCEDEISKRLSEKKSPAFDQSHKPVNQYTGPKTGTRVKFDFSRLSEADLKRLRARGQEPPWGLVGTIVEISYDRKKYFCFVELLTGERFMIDNFLAITEVDSDSAA